MLSAPYLHGGEEAAILTKNGYVGGTDLTRPKEETLRQASVNIEKVFREKSGASAEELH